MSRTKEHYHEEICNGLTLLQEAQILEQEACSHELEAPQEVQEP